MTKPGHIKIKDNKIIFVYHELDKPNEDHYFEGRNYVKKTNITLDEAMKEYEASKRSVKMGNIDSVFHGDGGSFCYIIIDKIKYSFKHNQSCEAEITGNKAMITKII
ncbi:hypothetical protein ES703_34567 [subsurface metagenome]